MNRERRAGISVRYAMMRDLPDFTGDVVSIDDLLAGEHHITPGTA